ncbi:DUF262 domain-containing protein [candidate division WOR-3 bacterium]|nr:DUF262 domain-containing protein [candidate division WOR-3 bacterium]
MKIRPKEITVGDLLNDKKIYVVPLFQRSFSWEAQQVADFWIDLMDTYEYKGHGNEYFIGSIVITPYDEDNEKKVKILDGQQRFATFLLFLAALRDVLSITELENAQDRIDIIKGILSTSDVVTIEKNPKLELNKEDKNYFESIVIDGEIPKPELKSHERIKNAYSFFKNEITKKIELENDKFVKGVLDSLFNKFLMIRIEVDDDINAHMIFETLNDRGLDLSVADLTKNYIFSLSSKKDLAIVMSSWQEVVDQVGGHNVTRFLRHFWISSYALVRKEELYKRLKNKVTESRVKKFIKDLATEATVYANLKSPTHEFWEDSVLENMITNFNILRVEQVYILLLALYNRFHDNIDIFKHFVKLLTNLTFRYSTVCGLNPNELERQYSILSIEVRKGKARKAEISKKLKNLSPPEDKFLMHFRDLEQKTSKLAKYLLSELNNYLLKKRDNRELITNINVVNLEHIIPKKPDKEWMKFFKEKDIHYEDLVNKVGNMTILLEEYNRKIANNFFHKKKVIYKKSKLPLNEDLCKYSEFGTKEVRDRQEEMGKIAEEFWRV